MGSYAKSFHLWMALVLCALLVACAGVAPGGSNPENTNPNSSQGVAGPLGDNAPGGAAVPSTQQSDSGMGVGGDCLFSFFVTVKVLRNGVEQSCQNAEPATHARRGSDFSLPTTTGSLAPEEEPVYGPGVTFSYKIRETSEEKLIKTATVCNPDGSWRTPEGAIRVFFNSDEEECRMAKVYTAASWSPVDKIFYSSEFHGPPLPAPDEQVHGINIVLTLELNPGEAQNPLIPALDIKSR